MTNLYVIGSLNMDLVTQTDIMPKLGETLLGSGFGVFPGGKGNNQAVAAARLGLNVHMIGCVGDDEFGTQLIDNLKRNNVKTQGITILPNTVSGIATIVLCDNDNFIILTGGANQKQSLDNFKKKADCFNNADIILLQNEIPFEINEFVIKNAYNNTKIIFNAAPAIKLDKNFYKYIDILIINEHECGYMLDTQINSIDDSINAVKYIVNMGIKNVIVTMGKNGAVYNDNISIGHVNACNVLPIDTTGAGDSFCSGIAVAIGEGKSLKEAVEFANCVSALSIMKEGAQSSMPYYDEVVEFQHKIKSKK